MGELVLVDLCGVREDPAVQHREHRVPAQRPEEHAGGRDERAQLEADSRANEIRPKEWSVQEKALDT